MSEIKYFKLLRAKQDQNQTLRVPLAQDAEIQSKTDPTVSEIANNKNAYGNTETTSEQALEETVRKMVQKHMSNKSAKRSEVLLGHLNYFPGELYNIWVLFK